MIENRIRFISTHTLTWSVTKKLNNYYRLKGISTHTLTWSVTTLTYINDPYKINFNSHAHVERDALNGNYGGYPNISTHTLTWSVTGKEKKK